MRIKEKVIEVIEMSREEETILWETAAENRRVLGRKVVKWDMDDGNNTLLLENEEGASWSDATWYAVEETKDK